MNRLEATSRIRRHANEFAGLGVASLAVFGSTVRDEASDSSDVDVLVEFTAPPTLQQFMGLKFLLEQWLDRPVDLVDRAALRDGWREMVEGEAVLVA